MTTIRINRDQIKRGFGGHFSDFDEMIEEQLERASLLERERIQLECRERATQLLHYAKNARSTLVLERLLEKAERVAVLARAADKGVTAREGKQAMTPAEWLAFGQRTGDYTFPAGVDMDDEDDFTSAVFDALNNRLPMTRLRGRAQGAPLACVSVAEEIRRIISPRPDA